MQFERPNTKINNGAYDQRLAATSEYMQKPPGVQVAQADTGTATDAISPSAWSAMGGQGAPPTAAPAPQGGLLSPWAQRYQTMTGSAPPNLAVNSKGMPYLPGTGGVPAGTPGAGAPITPAQAAAANAGGGNRLPVMPSDLVFGRGQVAPPGAGGAPAAAPQGGLLGPQTTGAPQAASGTPAPPQGVLAPQPQRPLASGGATDFNSPAWRAYIQDNKDKARAYTALGITVPPDVAAAATLPFKALEAGSAAEYPYKMNEAIAPQTERGNQTRQTQAEKFAFEPHFENGVMTQPSSLPGFVAPPSLGGRGVPGLGGGTPSGTPTSPAAPTSALTPNGSPGQVPGVMNDAQKMILQQGLEETAKRLNEPGGYHAEGKAAQEQIANAGAITDLLPRVRMGWNANTVQEGARILSSLGVDGDSIKRFTGTDPTAGDELNKLFLQFSAGAVRQMGAREPDSVISLFAKAFPNLETTPNAALLMTNALREQAQWKVDRANAADAWALNQQRNAGPTGENYQGMKGFDAAFGKTNDPRNYWRAAASMSNEPDIAWRGLDDAGKKQVFDLIPPGAQFRGGDGKLYPKPMAQ